MKMPRDVNGDQMVKLLGELEYQVTRQTGSHIRLTREAEHTHHLTIPKVIGRAWWKALDAVGLPQLRIEVDFSWLGA
ncbi:MAG: putative RNA binding protein YcfA (HicA-like mRNA interferase family) [Candidatus Latescibacterota bacterium]